MRADEQMTPLTGAARERSESFKRTAVLNVASILSTDLLRTHKELK